jgi:hypothetical protein
MLIGCILVFGLFASAQELPPAGPGGENPNFEDRGVTLVDSTGGIMPGSFATNSQAFLDTDPPGIVGYYNAAADDFTIPSCEAWSVDHVNVAGNYFTAIPMGLEGPAASVNVYIFSDAAGQPDDTTLGNALYVYEDLNYTDSGLADFSIPLPTPAILNGGAAGETYWIVVQANQAFINAGQWGWTQSTTDVGTNDAVWHQAFSGVLSTSSCVDSWGTLATCGVDGGTGITDLGFSLEGEVLAKMIVVSPGTVDISEDSNSAGAGMATASIDYWLSAPPCGPVTVDLTGIDSTELSLSTSSLMFTEANWDIPQTVTATVQNDGINDGDIMFAINSTGTSTDVGYNGVGPDVDVLVRNIDGVAVLTVSQTAVKVLEGGSMATVTISAGTDNPPSMDVTVGLSTMSSDITLSTPSVVLTGPGYSASFDVMASTDDMVEGQEMATIVTAAAVSADVDYSGLDPADINVTINDADTAEVIVSATEPIVVNEADAFGGGANDVTYTLSAIPASPVSFMVTSGDTSEGAMSANMVVLDNSNWNTGVTLTLSPEDDDIDDGNVNYQIVASNTSSADPFWNNLPVDNVDAQTTDDDTAGVTVNPTSLSIDEGMSDSFDVVLNSEPTFTVSIDITSGDTTEAQIYTGINPPGSMVTLSFDAANWDTPQTVNVDAIADMIRADGDQMVTITTASAVSADPVYSGINGADVTVTVGDIDPAAGVTVTPTSLTMDEDGMSMSFDVVLNTMPTASVTIPIGSGDASEATVSTTSLSFTAGNWNVPQSVTVTPVLDGIVDADQTFDLVNGPASGGNYAGVAVDNVSVTVNNVDICEPVDMVAQIGETLEIFGTPSCVLDLYDCTTEPATFVGTFTLDALGYVDTGILVGPDACYQAFITMTNTALNTPARTVPTLGEWGLIGMITMLMAAGVFFMRRRRTV